MAGVSFVAAIFIIRNLEPSQYGILQEMIAYFLIVQNFENLINFNLFKKRILNDPHVSHDLVMTLGLFISCCSLVACLLVAAIIILFQLPTHYWLLCLLLGGNIFRFSNGMTFYFDAHLKTKKTQISLNVGNLSSATYRVVASFLSPTALLQAIGYPLQYFAAFFTNTLQYERMGFKLRHFKLRTMECWTLVVLSFPVFLAGWAEILRDRLPFIFLGQYRPSAEVGYFAAGLKLIDPWLLVASALTISFWPKLAQAHAKQELVYRKAKAYYFAGIFYFFAFIGITEFLLSDVLILKIVGQKYLLAIPVLKIQCLAIIFQTLNIALSMVELNEGLAKNTLVRNLITLAVMIVSLFILVPTQGYLGGALSLLIANFVSCLVTPLFLNRSRKLLQEILQAPLLAPRFLIRDYFRES